MSGEMVLGEPTGTLRWGCSFLLLLLFTLYLPKSTNRPVPLRGESQKNRFKGRDQGESPFFLAELTVTQSGLSQPLASSRGPGWAELSDSCSGAGAAPHCWLLCPHMSPHVPTCPLSFQSLKSQHLLEQAPGRGRIPRCPNHPHETNFETPEL